MDKPMTALVGRILLLGTILSVFTGAAPPPTAPAPDNSEAMVAERDALIQKIIRGTNYDESVRRFVALYERRERSIMDSATTAAQVRQARDTQHAWRDTYHKTADYEVGWRCTLSANPKDPVPSSEGRFRGDWGRVTRKEVVRLPPKNALDEGEAWTLFEVKGEARSHLIHGDRFGLPDRSPLRAEVGDLVVLCDAGNGSIDKRLPPAWQTGPLVQNGFAARIASPPLIAKKARWNPTHITSTPIFWAIHDVRWKYPGFVLCNIEIGKDLGGGHYEIEALQGLSWLLEVPPKLAHRDALVPGRTVWAILGQARFDPALKKLVLVAEDLEERYIVEK